jgi:hypothetical protein
MVLLPFFGWGFNKQSKQAKDISQFRILKKWRQRLGLAPEPWNPLALATRLCSKN